MGSKRNRWPGKTRCSEVVRRGRSAEEQQRLPSSAGVEEDEEDADVPASGSKSSYVRRTHAGVADSAVSSARPSGLRRDGNGSGSGEFFGGSNGGAWPLARGRRRAQGFYL